MILPLEIRDQIYVNLIDQNPQDQKSIVKQGPAGNIIVRRNKLHSAILNTNSQVRQEVLQVFYRETVWHIRIPAASMLPRSPYFAFGSLTHLQQHPFFESIRHVKLEFMATHLNKDVYMGPHGEVSLRGRTRAFHPPTDVVPRRQAAEQICNALLHASALKSVTIEWSDVIGWGQWEEKFPILQPLSKLPVNPVMEAVCTNFTPRIDFQYLTQFLPKPLQPVHQETAACQLQNSIGKQNLDSYLVSLAEK